jgi:alpha/beta hydrolase family protein
MATTTFEIAQREPVLGGRPFGDVGAYEKIAGTLRFAVDPGHQLHTQITDLDRAPRNAADLVEFSADFYVLRPVDPARGNGALLLDVPNRGRKVALGMFNSTPRANDPTTEADFGNGFLLRHGYTVAWVGWQCDVPRMDGLMVLDAPIVRGVRGFVRCEFRPNLPAARLPMADRYHVPQPTVALDDPEARMTVRESVGAERIDLPRGSWRFATPTHVEVDGGFVPGHIYELVYRAQDPAVVGAGLLAVRDAGAWLRFGGADSGNPCAGTIDRAYVFAVSQTGRFLRHFLYLALNEDERGRRVFDAVMPHVAGGRRGEFNMRFGQPSLNAKESAGSLFPFTDVEQPDPLTGARGSLLGRQAARGGLPRIVSTNTAAEYWRGDGSLVHTDVEARVDVETVPEARVYFFAGTQHTPGALPPVDADPNTGGRGRQRFNVVDYAPLLRAVLVNLDAWVKDGVAPPPSAVPRLADGSAVPAEATEKAFTAIPGVKFPNQIERPARLDFGPDWPRGICTTLPPDVGASYATVVSAVDADGNDVAGIRPVELRVPVGTFTGWNLRHPDQGAPGDLMSMMGSTLPFCRTADERARRGDPRPSVAERYASRDDYLARVRAACAELVALRHMLAEDVDPVVARAGRLYDWVQAGA